MLNKDFPNSRGKDVKVYFSDAFEINPDCDDKTSEVMKELYDYAKNLDDFQCE